MLNRILCVLLGHKPKVMLKHIPERINGIVFADGDTPGLISFHHKIGIDHSMQLCKRCDELFFERGNNV